MSLFEDARRAKNWPSIQEMGAPHASGGGATSASHTGTGIGSVDCTALAGLEVNVFSIKADKSALGSDYMFAWATSAGGSPAFVGANVTADRTVANTAMVPSILKGYPMTPQYVDPERPILIFKPIASVTAEMIVVAVGQPDILA